MTKLEYADYHKFLASLGAALIVFAGAMPWLFLREKFDLYAEQQQLTLLTPTAKTIIENRQDLVSNFLCLVPWLSLLIFVSGLGCLIFALVKWQRKQGIEDEKSRLGLEALKRSSDKMNEEEISKKGKMELDEIGEFEQEQIPEKIFNSEDRGHARVVVSPIQNYLQAEQRVIERIEQTMPSGYELLERSRVGGREFDAVLASQSAKRSDILVEIKYFSKIPTKDVFYRVRDRLVSTAIDYTRATGRSAVGLVVIVAKDKSVADNLVKDWLRPIVDLKKEHLRIPLFILEETKLPTVDFAEAIAEEPLLRR